MVVGTSRRIGHRTSWRNLQLNAGSDAVISSRPENVPMDELKSTISDGGPRQGPGEEPTVADLDADQVAAASASGPMPSDPESTVAVGALEASFLTSDLTLGAALPSWSGGGDALAATLGVAGPVRPGDGAAPVDGKRIRVFGDYELIRLIARGGMGIVYQARQKKLGRIVALKMILQGDAASSEDVRRLHLEAEAAAVLDHPGIVPIYEAGTIDGQDYFSMGYVEGGSLEERVVARGPLPLRQAAAIVRQVAEAVEFAHGHGIVHRDLKPANVLLDRDGNPKVSDFGLAKRLRDDSHLTASGTVLGTPSYMAPEQAAGRLADVGPLSDVHGLGAILYRLLVGKPPFYSATTYETIRQVLEAEPVAAPAQQGCRPRPGDDLPEVSAEGTGSPLRISPGPRRRPGPMVRWRADRCAAGRRS